jgi:cytochrome bd-type quinol oxidase subunit 2
MMKKNNLKKLITRIFAKELLISSLIAFLIGFTPTLANAQIVGSGAKSQACAGVGGGSGGCVANPEGSINNTLTNAINIFSVLIGIIAVIMAVVAGFKYVVSNGDTNGINSAKETLVYALVGLAVVAFAQALVHFVLFRATTAASGG